MTRAVLVVGPIEPPIGGVSRYCRGLVDLLNDEGSKAIPFEPPRPGAAEPGLLSRALRSPVSRVFGRGTLSLALAVRRHGAGLVVDNRQALWRDPACARGARLLVRVPYVLAIHDGAFPEFVETLAERERRALGRTLRRLPAVLCMSAPILESVQRMEGRARVFGVTPLLSVPRSSASSLPAEIEAFLAAPGPIVCASGALHPQYGLEELLAAFEAMRGRGSRARLLLLLGGFAEDRSTRAALDAARARLGDEGILVLRDFQDGAAVVARSQLYVRPSRVDSFGMALHEAMLCGVPVVASAHPTRPEGALTYPPGDPRALAEAIEAGLRPAARSAALGLVDRLKLAVDRNRRQTRSVLAAVSGASRGPIAAGGPFDVGPSVADGSRGRAGSAPAGGR